MGEQVAQVEGAGQGHAEVAVTFLRRAPDKDERGEQERHDQRQQARQTGHSQGEGKQHAGRHSGETHSPVSREGHAEVFVKGNEGEGFDEQREQPDAVRDDDSDDEGDSDQCGQYAGAHLRNPMQVSTAQPRRICSSVLPNRRWRLWNSSNASMY